MVLWLRYKRIDGDAGVDLKEERRGFRVVDGRVGGIYGD